ncbi:hypothetical protein BC936DRAFT_137485 [Jimgerdemannia flammicorona]|uniref:Uncharacterized protein n=1 Tax=Jimgerdemannia flammicorona TaxID=994334 RepID=A0A433CX98_9FUNG|nr:hypothetical protein BC936DRAFT_137485 [Jimgerdemannia flammicorona]
MLASRLTFSKHALISRSFVCSIRFSQLYSTTTKSQLANHRMLSTKSNHDNKTLVYIGPSTNTIRNYKMTASMFGICGLVTIPALLWMGQAHMLGAIIATWGISASTTTTRASSTESENNHCPPLPSPTISCSPSRPTIYSGVLKRRAYR